MSPGRGRDLATALAARSFPRARCGDAVAVRDCARDAIDSEGLRALPRECAGLVLAGLRARAGVARGELRAAPWRAALAVLPLPLAAALLLVWTFGFVPRYDHWPLGEGWALLLGGSLVAVIGAAFEARWVVVLGAAGVFVAAGSPYVGYGTEAALSDTPTFFPASGVDLGAASLIPALLLAGAVLTLPRRRKRSLREGTGPPVARPAADGARADPPPAARAAAADHRLRIQRPSRRAAALCQSPRSCSARPTRSRSWPPRGRS